MLTREKTVSARIFHIIVAIIMVIIMAITLYPIYYSVINSLNDGSDLTRHGYVFLLPRKFTFASWQTVLSDATILSSFLVTLSRTIIVTVLQTFNTAMFTYGFSRPYLRGKKFYTVIGFVSMYFNGGIISTFLMFNWMHLYDSYWVYIIPWLFGGFYNVIIFNANFKAIPEALFESAMVDGANEFRQFIKIVLPLSKPVLAALGVFTACGTWNDYQTTLFYTMSKKLQTLPYFTLSMIRSSQATEDLALNAGAASSAVYDLLNKSVNGPVTAKTIELSSMVLSAIPLILLYPFAQKFFQSGVMVGSVKG